MICLLIVNGFVWSPRLKFHSVLPCHFGGGYRPHNSQPWVPRKQTSRDYMLWNRASEPRMTSWHGDAFHRNVFRITGPLWGGCAGLLLYLLFVFMMWINLLCTCGMVRIFSNEIEGGIELLICLSVRFLCCRFRSWNQGHYSRHANHYSFCLIITHLRPSNPHFA